MSLYDSLRKTYGDKVIAGHDVVEFVFRSSSPRYFQDWVQCDPSVTSRLVDFYRRSGAEVIFVNLTTVHDSGFRP